MTYHVPETGLLLGNKAGPGTMSWTAYQLSYPLNFPQAEAEDEVIEKLRKQNSLSRDHPLKEASPPNN